MPGWWDDITGKSGEEAAEESAAIQSRAADAAMSEQRAAFGDVQNQLAPYTQAGEAGLGMMQDLILGRRYNDPVLQEMGAQRMEMAERQLRGSGVGGGARLKRLMQIDAQNQLAQRQSRLGEAGMLMGALSPAAAQLANARTGMGTNVSNLLTSQGAANAAGVIGAQQAGAAGTGNLLQLGGMALGGMTGGLGGAAAGGQLGGMVV